jgi:xylulokinase
MHGAVQDAGGWWDSVLALGRSALAKADPARVVAVSCTSQWASVVPVDEEGEPLAPCVMWLDTRGARHSREVVGGPLMGYSPRALALWIRRTAGIPSPQGGDTVSHILQIERDRPELAKRVRWYLEPVDYLTMRLCGRATATHASMIGAWLTDNRALDRMAYDPRLLRRTGIDPEKLAPLVPIGTLIGEVGPEPAARLGLRPGVEVVTGIPDLHSAAFGAGAAGMGEAHMPIGTTSWISLPFGRKKTDVMRSIASVPGLDQSSYLVVNNHEAAGLALRWAREALAAGEPQPWEELFELAESAPPGSGGVIFTPWIAGERSPVDDRSARGGWHNLSVDAGHADLLRAVL